MKGSVIYRLKLSRQEQMEMMKNNEERLKKQMREMTTENKTYSADLQVAQETVTELSRQLVNYEKDKQCLTVSVSNTRNDIALFTNQKYND